LAYDFENMAAHELGHGLKLNHSGEIEATMYESMSLGETKKKITSRR
jgi:predicted Zn-dependent protease